MFAQGMRRRGFPSIRATHKPMDIWATDPCVGHRTPHHLMGHAGCLCQVVSLHGAMVGVSIPCALCTTQGLTVAACDWAAGTASKAKGDETSRYSGIS